MVITASNYETFKDSRYIKNQVNFGGKLFLFTHDISDSQSYEDFFAELKNGIEIANVHSFRLCLADGFLLREISDKMLFDESMTIDGIVDLQGGGSFTLAYGYKNGRRLAAEAFVRSQLLPGIREIIASDDEGNLFFFPVCHNNKYVGYVAIEFADELNIDFNSIFTYILNFSTNLGIVKSNNDMSLAMSKLQYMYMHDQMTQLYNRRGFYADVGRLLSDPQNAGKCLTAMSIDMDNLKPINDTYGHHEGDSAIKVTAGAILHAGESYGAISARFGGDEFVTVFLTDAPDKSVQGFTRALHGYLDRYNADSGKQYAVLTSIGHAAIPVADLGRDIDSLIKAADESMYSDKKRRKAYRRAGRASAGGDDAAE
jgi:diguanylate cyclase (GGDEF)-like protein